MAAYISLSRLLTCAHEELLTLAQLAPACIWIRAPQTNEVKATVYA